MENLQYISLGGDCSIAYQLQKYNLRNQAFPFDWIKTNNLNDIITLLENNFQFFVGKNFLEVKEISNKFPLLVDNWNEELSENIVLKHKLFNITFPHELSKENSDIDNIIEKYIRRIERFNQVICNDKIKKIFIRITNKNNQDEENKLKRILELKATNFEIRYIRINKKDKFSSWKKDELDWKTILG